MTTIAFLGPDGTFAHAAAKQLRSVTADLRPMPSVTHAIDALRGGDVDGALVPLENSVEGAVPATLDALAEGSPLVIVEETYLPVTFDLLARAGTQLDQVRSIATHPHAEAQTRRWTLDHLPDATVVLTSSTAEGARAAAAGEYDAGIAPPVAGELFGLESLAHDIADNPGAVTRFVLLRRPMNPPAPTGNDRTSLVAYLRADHPGALLEILTEFSTRSVNLTRIESRPTKDRMGDYSFSVDAEGHLYDERVGQALAALHRVCAEVRYLGSYPREDGVQSPIPETRTDAAYAESARWLGHLRARGD